MVPAEIASTRFEECLEGLAKAHGWTSTADVRSIECQRVEGVSDYGIGIETLEGVQVFTNLEEIVIYGAGILSAGRVGDLSPLSSLDRLRVIEMYDSDVRSLEALRGISSLERVVFIPTLFGDISPLADLPNLKHLNLSLASSRGDSLITDFSPLARISSLEELQLPAQPGVREYGLGFLSGLTNLKVLDISENSFQDLEGLQHVPFLEELDLSYNFVFSSGRSDDPDYAILGSLTNLKTLFYERYDGIRLDFLSSMQALEVLALTRISYLENSDAAITRVGSLPNLKELYFGGLAIGDISPLQGLSNLEVLWIADANVDSTTLAFPETLASLRTLSLLDAFSSQYNFGDQRGDFKNSYAVFSDLPQLTDLNLDRPWLNDPSALALNANIQSLSLVEARLPDVRFLLDMPGLRSLDLSGNPFTEMSFLAELPNLERLTINDTSISCDELAAFTDAAPAVEVTTDLFCS